MQERDKNITAGRTAPAGGENIYDLTASQIREQEERIADAAVSRISQSDANSIIRGLNEQFEKKVLSKLRESAPHPGLAAARERERNVSGAPDGRSLDDYLGTLRGGHPYPFADADSHFDLSKLAANQKS